MTEDMLGWLQETWETQLKALKGLLEELLRPAKRAALHASALSFAADQVAAQVLTADVAADGPTLDGLKYLMQSALTKLQVLNESFNRVVTYVTCYLRLV